MIAGDGQSLPFPMDTLAIDATWHLGDTATHEHTSVLRAVIDHVLAWEWPTLAVVAAIYGGWLAVLGHQPELGAWPSHAALTVLACWFMSLQHELLHGHPTRHSRINRLLGLAPLAVWIPYDLYRRSHLEHHRDAFLTLPGTDPEGNYLHAHDFSQRSAWQRGLWIAQRTVLGRLLFGPAMAIIPSWIDIVRKPLRGDFSQSRIWAQHLSLLLTMLWALDRYAGIHPASYLFGVAYPALSLAMLRSLYEHRPAVQPAHRIVVNEAALPWRLLYLNNNYHAVHHDAPSLPWYQLRKLYLQDRAGYLDRNGGFLIPGYFHLLRRFAAKPVDSPAFDASLPQSQPSSSTVFPANVPVTPQVAHSAQGSARPDFSDSRLKEPA